MWAAAVAAGAASSSLTSSAAEGGVMTSKRRREPQFLYGYQDSRGFIKLGQSKDPRNRPGTEFIPIPLHFIGQKMLPFQDGDTWVRTDKDVPQILGQHRLQFPRGSMAGTEWYNPNPPVIEFCTRHLGSVDSRERCACGLTDLNLLNDLVIALATQTLSSDQVASRAYTTFAILERPWGDLLDREFGQFIAKHFRRIPPDREMECMVGAWSAALAVVQGLVGEINKDNPQLGAEGVLLTAEEREALYLLLAHNGRVERVPPALRRRLKKSETQ